MPARDPPFSGLAELKARQRPGQRGTLLRGKADRSSAFGSPAADGRGCIRNTPSSLSSACERETTLAVRRSPRPAPPVAPARRAAAAAHRTVGLSGATTPTAPGDQSRAALRAGRAVTDDRSARPVRRTGRRRASIGSWNRMPPEPSIIRSTLRALLHPRRLIPIVLVSASLVAAQASYSAATRWRSRSASRCACCSSSWPRCPGACCSPTGWTSATAASACSSTAPSARAWCCRSASWRRASSAWGARC